VRAAIATGLAEVRSEVWRLTGATKGIGPIYLDINAPLIEIHSENKEETGAKKGGFGFHPLLCFADCTGEALAGLYTDLGSDFHARRDPVRARNRAVDQLRSMG
jgi:hypothetical protein